MSISPQGSGTDLVIRPNIFNVRSFNDFIAMLYAILPALTPILLSYGVLSDDEVALWIGLGTNVCQLILQFVRTEYFARRIIYTILNLAVSVLVVYRGLDPNFLDQWLPLLVLILGAPPAAVAVQNVNTSGDNVVPINRGLPPEGGARHAA
ncbi:holin [Gordonia phage Demosthenes]|uniref:Holin n=1 Tax=Gordonia phage Demosthenes TaxID=1838067 RepID=A0A160DE08_9CAUD|nr:holin [Gordonia phage Demosthenes]ANA86001.1 hypothetical protein PBI_DEMOSTHENES_31 [Gordonia phage Demosthenes]